VAAEPETGSAPERLLREDLDSPTFSSGVDRGWWRVVSIEFPYVVIEIAAAPRPNGPEWWAFRFAVSTYPQAPSAQPWDISTGSPLAPERWPTGNGRIQRIFNPGWCLHALYLPMDGVALQGHDEWLTKHSCYVWDAGKDITQYLRVLHALLNEEAYTGARG
jgi:hypothetical protein